MQMIMTILTRFGTKGLNLFTFLILARGLALDEFGIYGFVFTTTMLASVLLDFGLRNSSAFFIGEEKNDISNITKSILLFWLYMLPVMFCICFLLMYVTYPNLSFYEVILPTIITGSALLFIRMIQGIHLGDGNIAQINRSDLIPKVILFIGVTLLSFKSLLTLSTALWLFALTNIVCVGYLLFGIKTYISNGNKLFDNNLLLVILKRGGLFMIGALCMIAYKKTGFYAVTFAGSVQDSGIYFGTTRLAEVITEVCLAISMVLFSQNVRDKNDQEKLQKTARTLRISIFFLGLFGLLCIPFSELILTFALGKEFADFQLLYQIGLLAAILGIIPTILFPTLTTLFDSITVARWYLLAVVFSAISSYFLYNYMGLNGVAVILALTNVCLTFIIVNAITKINNSKTLDYLVITKSDFSDLISLVFKRKKAKK